MDSEDTLSDALSFIKSSGVTFPVGDDGTAHVMNGVYGFEGDPYAVFIEGSGRIMTIHPGPLSPSRFVALERQAPGDLIAVSRARHPGSSGGWGNAELRGRVGIGTWSSRHVRLDIGRKDPQRTPGHGDGSVGMSARPTSVHLVEAADGAGSEDWDQDPPTPAAHRSSAMAGRP